MKNGTGRLDDNIFDRFVLTRKLNHPELLFNQNTKYDQGKNAKYRFFKPDAQKDWKLSAQNECYLCNKHQYTLIFYDKNCLYRNKGLTEIKDKVLLKQIKDDFNKNYKHFGSMTPIICGSVVNKRFD